MVKLRQLVCGMTKMKLSLGEGEPVNDLVGCERWEADNHGSDRNGGGGGQGGIGSEGFFETAF